MWKNVAKTIKQDARNLQDYYHNTFIKEFYASPQDFKEEIRALIVAHQDSFDTEVIFRKLAGNHPELEFNQRLTKQLISIQHIRMKEKLPKSSVDDQSHLQSLIKSL